MQNFTLKHYLSKYHMLLDWINLPNNPECPSKFRDKWLTGMFPKLVHVAQILL